MQMLAILRTVSCIYYHRLWFQVCLNCVLACVVIQVIVKGGVREALSVWTRNNRNDWSYKDQKRISTIPRGACIEFAAHSVLSSI
jgi:hypothetical protein